jgi:hypothetical protein
MSVTDDIDLSGAAEDALLARVMEAIGSLPYAVEAERGTEPTMTDIQEAKGDKEKLKTYLCQVTQVLMIVQETRVKRDVTCEIAQEKLASIRNAKLRALSGEGTVDSRAAQADADPRVLAARFDAQFIKSGTKVWAGWEERLTLKRHAIVLLLMH